MKKTGQNIVQNIVVIGSGKLAGCIIDNLPKTDAEGVFGSVVGYEDGMHVDYRSVFVHVGSGRQYAQSLKLAADCGSVYIQASTVKHTVMDPPREGVIPFVHAPNLDLNIIRFLFWLKQAGALFGGERIKITESHQSGKTSVPGTAYKMAEALGVDPAAITSVRDPHRQFELGITDIGRHAWHRIAIGGGNSVITLETKVEGLLSYVEGLSRILKVCGKLGKRNYEIEELVEEGLI